MRREFVREGLGVEEALVGGAQGVRGGGRGEVRVGEGEGRRGGVVCGEL